ncbi:MAG: hypothetical protein AAGF73_10395 [Actinomycetota bacterium]
MPTESIARQQLHRVATHVVSRARAAVTERISLRVLPGGIGTPAFSGAGRRVRIVGSWLVVEDEAAPGGHVVSTSIVGSSLQELAEVAAVDLDAPYDAGPDTPPIGDRNAAIDVDSEALESLAAWFVAAGAAVDDAVIELASRGLAVTGPRLWPEHFDVAIEVHLADGTGINLGGSPGDGFSAEPYLYVGPWGPERPGDDGFWNAPFGAVFSRTDLQARGTDHAGRFFAEGVARLT